MTKAARDASQHPAPHADRVTVRESFFALFGGPIAWFVQLCSGYALASRPCFIDGDRSWLPAVDWQWTWSAMIGVVCIAVIIALFALTVSWRAYRRTQNEALGSHDHLMEVGEGRTRFLSLWGVVLAAGFSGTTALTAVAIALLPRCSG